MNIIIFCAAGFIGTNLVKRLAKLDGINLTLIDADIRYFGPIKGFRLPNIKCITIKFLKYTYLDDCRQVCNKC